MPTAEISRLENEAGVLAAWHSGAMSKRRSFFDSFLDIRHSVCLKYKYRIYRWLRNLGSFAERFDKRMIAKTIKRHR
jgi:hypothetical protein